MHFDPSQEQLNNSSLSFSEALQILLGLLGLLGGIYAFELEPSLNLLNLMGVVIIGFIVSILLPLSFRLPALLAATFASFLVFFPLKVSILILGLGLGLFGILNSALSVRWRIRIIIVLGVILAAWRLDWLPFPQPSVVLSVVGGLFMFRSILFLYEEQFATTSQSIWLRLCYFFMLPNLVLLIFPVVDYKTFCQGYYAKGAFQTYRKAILWMANGLLHFLLYRLIYYYFIPSPAEVVGVLGWLQYVIFTYLLIVRLAGIFHFAAGVLCLFGFDLPPTFYHYFFADSFGELWRRINRYWRDFVMKVFYYPLYFKIKHLGPIKAIGLSVLLTFAINWFLHAYQWLWLKGTLLFTLQDISFWAAFGVAVAGNSVYKTSQRRRQRQQPNNKGIWSEYWYVLRVMGVFSFMAVLWSWWTAPSIDQWWEFLQIWGSISKGELLLLLGCMVAVFGLGVLLYRWDKYTRGKEDHWRNDEQRHYNFSVVVMFVLIVFARAPVRSYFEDKFELDLQPVVSLQLNQMDRDVRFQGYYESMLGNSQLVSTPLEDLQSRQPANWKQLVHTGALHKEEELLERTLKPNMEVEFKGKKFITNRFGMHDFEMDSLPASDTYRMALLGGSIEMGSGVEREHTYENRLTRLLNEDSLFFRNSQVEIMNFGVSWTHMPQHLARLDQIVGDFNPRMVIYAGHPGEFKRVAGNLFRLYREGVDLEYTILNDPVNALNLGRDVERNLFLRTIRPKMPNILEDGYQLIRDKIESMGAVPVFIFVPTFDDKQSPEEDDLIVEIARAVGFFVLDLRGFDEGFSTVDLMLAEWDAHPSILGHQLLAEELYRQMINETSLRELIENHGSK